MEACQILLVAKSLSARALCLRLQLPTAAMRGTDLWDSPSGYVSPPGTGQAVLQAARKVCAGMVACSMINKCMIYCMFNFVTVDCGSLPDPTGGQVTFSQSTVFESVATYSCSEGYTLMGQTQQTCLSTGLWSGNTPRCNRGVCLTYDVVVLI